jgi:hypothetical protein
MLNTFPHAGPQKELDIWPVFGLLADMLVRPGGIASVHLFMIGPDVPEDMHNKQQLLGATMKHIMHRKCTEEGACVRQLDHKVSNVCKTPHTQPTQVAVLLLMQVEGVSG